ANSSTWAAQNPSCPIIHRRTTAARLSDAQKASRKIKKDQRTEIMKRLHDAIIRHLQEQKHAVELLSHAHHVTLKHINDMISNQPIGSRYTLTELREMIAEDPQMQNLMRDEKATYVAALSEHREQKVSNMRANNMAAVRDVLVTTERIVKELDELRVRTGTYGTLFVIHGHINDTIQSTMHGTDNSDDFWEDVYDLPMADFLRQYEQWACTQNQSNCSDGEKDIAMNYNNYDTAIVEMYAVRLVGWPTDVNFISPSNIGTVGEIWKLHDALKGRTCYWTVLMPAEVKAHTAKLNARHSAGEVVWHPRKKRSDAGKSRKR
ncbi:hypothetical protein BDR03DRAFT_845642, partial [Suillus americanus]